MDIPFDLLINALAAGLLWLATFVAVVGCRKLARLVAGRAVAIERCLVIGRVEQAERVRDKLRSARARAQVVATLPLADDVRVEVLNALIGTAEAKNQDAFERELIAQLAKVDPSQEGHGYATQLIEFALDDVRSRGLRVIPVCPLVLSYLQKHPG